MTKKPCSRDKAVVISSQIPSAKVILVGAAAHGGEGQDRNRRLVRQ